MEMEKYKKWQDKAPLLIALGTVLPLPHTPPPSQSGILISSRKIFYSGVLC